MPFEVILESATKKLVLYWTTWVPQCNLADGPLPFKIALPQNLSPHCLATAMLTSTSNGRALPQSLRGLRPSIPLQDLRSPDQRSPDQRSPDQRSPDQRSPDQRSPDQRSPDQRSPDQRSPDQRSPDQRSPDQRSPDQRSPDQRSPDQRSPDPSKLTV